MDNSSKQCCLIKEIGAVSKKRNKHSGEKGPEIPASYVEAFMIMMLHKIGGSQTISLKQLLAFDKASGGKHTEFVWDEETQSVTLKAPDYVSPDKPKIIRQQEICLN